MSRRRRSRWKIFLKRNWLKMLIIMGMVSGILSLLCITQLEMTKGPNGYGKFTKTTKIAFGSGTSRDYRSQPVWVDGVIKSNPDAWIWVGNMAYMDKPWVNCNAVPWHLQCNCTNDWLHQPNHSCMAGNIEFAKSRIEVQLSNPDYAKFLAFMCPGHRAKRLHPPPGSDPSVCSRPILGTYDDHDYGWEHGNKRLPQKDAMKQLFLDALGEPIGSPRRSPGHGIEWKHTLNNGNLQQTIDIYLLDQRYYRDTLPCYLRKSFCQKVALGNNNHQKHAWCQDFLYGGDSTNGSCCKKDEEIFYGWCSQSSNKKHALWQNLCDPSSPEFGHNISFDLIKHISNGDGTNSTPFCDVLGENQRKWFEDALLKSTAPIKLVVSSSALIGNPAKKTCEDMDTVMTDIECPCSGDDWDCYKPAQLRLLNVLSQSPGCVIVLSGGSEYSDIKVVKPGRKNYWSLDLAYPLYQVTASGLTMTAERNFSCDALRQDPLHLRDHSECDFVQAPSFGMIEVDWEKDRIIKIQVRDGMTADVKLESTVNIGNCLNRQMPRKVKGG